MFIQVKWLKYVLRLLLWKGTQQRDSCDSHTQSGCSFFLMLEREKCRQSLQSCCLNEWKNSKNKPKIYLKPFLYSGECIFVFPTCPCLGDVVNITERDLAIKVWIGKCRARIGVWSAERETRWRATHGPIELYRAGRRKTPLLDVELFRWKKLVGLIHTPLQKNSGLSKHWIIIRSNSRINS